MRRTYLFSLSVIGIFFATLAFAAGGGGGGSVPTPSCDADTWTCGEWSSCSLSGTRTRTCALTFDCGYVTTPKPSESETCTPPCTADLWDCSGWSECSPAGKQSRVCTMTYDCPAVVTPQPESASEQRPCIPRAQQQEPPKTGPATPPRTCKQDTWTCGSWSACDPEGNQSRGCRRSFDCVYVDTPQPENIRRCQELQCGNKATLRERIQCRLSLTPAGLTRELEIQYLPEECRTLTEGRQACIAKYRAWQPCWQETVGTARNGCAMRILSIGSGVVDAVRLCQQKEPGTERASCMQKVRESAYDMIKFRFYDLEERAEGLAEEGKADVSIVADFVNLIETKKQEFNRATTKQQRRQIILDVRRGWIEFMQKVKQQPQP